MLKNTRIELLLFGTLIMILTLYAPVELTRVIVINRFVLGFYADTPGWQFILEMALFWIMYLGIIPGLYLFHKVTKGEN